VPGFARVIRRKLRVLQTRAAEARSVRRQHGTAAAMQFAATVAGSIVRERFFRAPPQSNSFDEQFGTDTAAKTKLHTLDIESPNYGFAIYYEPTDSALLDVVLAALPVRHEDYSFIDYGCGKGLVVLRAASYPFRNVVGVEFARELHAIARMNLERHPAALRRAPVEFVHADAIEYAPPPGNLVLYAYEPFEAPETRKLLARIESFLPGRDVVVAYVWSKNRGLTCKPLWDRTPFLAPIVEADGWTLYRGRAARF
jgi:predicted RNA methylase